jgi:long-subunit acyl-CoA synthetase (AMP-forming)
MQITEDDSYFSYLPLAHIFDQVIENYCISKGASIGFWQGVRTNCCNFTEFFDFLLNTVVLRCKTCLYRTLGT